MDKINNFFVQTYYYLTSGIFLRNFLYMLGISALLLVGVFWYLSSYTLHGSYVQVPDLTKITLNEAQRLLSTRSLKIQVIDSVYDPSKTASTILEQFPAADSKVKDSRTIYVVVNTNSPTSVDLYYKNLIGKHFSEVQRRLLAAKLQIAEIKETPDPDQKAEGTVKEISCGGKIIFLEADPARGIKPNLAPVSVPRGSKITITIYKGKDSGFKPVPDVLCLNYAGAELALKSAGMLIAKLEVEAGILDTANAIVSFQEPSGNSFVNLGTPVRLKLSKEKPLSCDELPLELPENQ
jgi:eukaryotic-like serine/threonine-protein kinase